MYINLVSKNCFELNVSITAMCRVKYHIAPGRSVDTEVESEIKQKLVAVETIDGTIMTLAGTPADNEASIKCLYPGTKRTRKIPIIQIQKVLMAE